MGIAAPNGMGIAAPRKKKTPPDSCNQEASLHKSCVLEAGILNIKYYEIT